MKFTTLSALLLALVATSSHATSIRAVARQLPDASQTKSRNNVGRGSPSYLEFVTGKCIGFDQKKEGEKAKAVSCGDAPEFVYRGDYLVEWDGTGYCLEADRDDIYLRECDNDDDEQKWLFTAAVNKKKRVYRMFNYDTRYFVEKVNDRVTLQVKDRNDEDQLLKELDADFFDTN